MVSKPKVSIIILNWNGLEDTIECLESLEKITYPNYKIIVVDNCSKGNDAKVLKERFGGYIHVIENDENYGFGEGCNIGIRYALAEGADYLLMLNNDTVVDSKFLDELVKTFENTDRAGIVGPLIYCYNAPGDVWHRGGVLSLYLGSHHIGGVVGNKFFRNASRFKQLQWYSGCAMMISRDVIEKVGIFDPEYFYYAEDADLGYRVYRSGYKILCSEESIIWHKGGKSTGSRLNPLSAYYGCRNSVLFIRKHGRLYHKLIFIPVYIFRIIVHAITHYGTQHKVIKYQIRGLLQQEFKL